MRSSAADAPSVRFVIDLCTTEEGVSGWLQRVGATAVPFSSWLELLALLEPPES